MSQLFVTILDNYVLHIEHDYSSNQPIRDGNNNEKQTPISTNGTFKADFLTPTKTQKTATLEFGKKNHLRSE